MKKLVRKNIQKLIPYSSARNEFIGKDNILLDANELAFNEPLNRYPDPLQTELKEIVSQKKQIPVSNILLGNGSDECIDLLVRAFCEPNVENIITVSPSYGIYDVIAQINGIELRKVNLLADFQLDSESILKTIDSNTKLIILCNPNNPTANSFSETEIIQLLKKFGGLVLIDEAYIDFSQNKSFLKYLAQYENLIITQTLSKSYGLAAIRLGILYGNKFIINTLNKVKYPYNVNALTINEAVRQLTEKNNKPWVDEIIRERTKLQQALIDLPFVEQIFDSNTNFLLVKFKNAKAVQELLLQNRIVVRDRSQHELTKECLRITVGTADQNKLLIETLKKLAYEKSNIL